MNTPHHNVKVAENRGDSWKQNLRASRLDVQLNPTSLRLKRLKKKLTQADIASTLDVSLSTYTAIERGKRTLKIEQAKKIAEILSASFSNLFSKEIEGRCKALKAA